MLNMWLINIIVIKLKIILIWSLSKKPSLLSIHYNLFMATCFFLWQEEKNVYFTLPTPINMSYSFLVHVVNFNSVIIITHFLHIFQ